MDLRFEALGDQAVMAYAADEQQAAQFANLVRQAELAWAIDVVQAYVSVAIFYDLAVIDFFRARTELSSLVAKRPAAPSSMSPKRHLIPCCYELGQDMERIARHTGLSAEEIIRLHSATVYTVYAIGFCPGFPYLGYLPPPLTGVPRLLSPRLRVEQGSVGLTGRQTGIYTMPRPGGWNIVGRTPLKLVNVEEGYFPIRTGDEVQFVRIDEGRFGELMGERIAR